MEAQQQLAERRSARAGRRRPGQVSVKGSGEVVAVTIDPKVVDPDDIETLQDLIVGAMADASKQVDANGAAAAGCAGRWHGAAPRLRAYRRCAGV